MAEAEAVAEAGAEAGAGSYSKKHIVLSQHLKIIHASKRPLGTWLRPRPWPRLGLRPGLGHWIYYWIYYRIYYVWLYVWLGLRPGLGHWSKMSPSPPSILISINE